MIQGFYFYEKQERGLGEYFLVNLYAGIESLKIFGGIHEKAYKNFQKALSKKFPYVIYYTVEYETMKVRANIDYRRSSSWIKEHLKDV